MQSSVLLSPILLLSYQHNTIPAGQQSHKRTHKYLLRQDRLAPDSRFYLKISERLKSNFFSLVPARRLSRPTILDPGPYQP